MECTKAEALICTLTDGALSDAERGALEKHVHECSPCRELRDDLARQDRELRDAFEGPRGVAGLIAEKSIASLRRGHSRNRWLPYLLPLAAAAGFMIALLGFRRERVVEIVREVPVQVPAPVVTHTPARSAGRVLQVTGDVVLRPREEQTWITCGFANTFEAGTTIRCADDALAELETSEGSIVRLAPGTAVCFDDDRAVRLLNGRLMSKISAGATPYTVTAGKDTVTANGATIDVSVLAPNVHALCVVEGTAEFRGRRVVASQRITSNDGECGGGAVEIRDVVMATRWVHPLLVRQPDSGELRARIASLVDRATDASHERELRSLGGIAGSFLVDYLRAGKGEAARRPALAVLAADIAGATSVTTLIELLGDRDEGVRMEAFRALTRLTGETLGQKADDWRTPSESRCAAWSKWRKDDGGVTK